ncbi:MAG: 50S ribosomal protein P1 [Candidatus Parvarchaeota archaeon]|jgi:large subunit ribosomal protein L12|nr:50S ribosomal protein P1 [Candidatus Parvarchaeota archaeon]MCL5018129.1 50S ribosomal protein P1 [Candidatus Parvarchaeota archaeon]
MEYVYAAMLLHSFGKDVTEESMKKLVSAAGVEPDEAQIKAVVSSLKGVDIDKVISEAQVVASAPQAAPAQQAPEHKKEEHKEEPKPEEAAAGLSSLFG